MTRKISVRRARDLKLCGLALLIMGTLACVHLVAMELPWLRRLELSALDVQMRLRGKQPAGPETVIVMIDDRTISELGRWPVPRRKMADLFNLLHGAGAKVIGVDVLFADPEPATEAEAEADANARRGITGDAVLARAIVDAGNVVLPFTFTFGVQGSDAAKPDLTRTAYGKLHKSPNYHPLALQPTGVLAPIAPLADAATLGHMLVAYDVDGAPRYDYPALEFDLDFYPSMAVRIVQRFLGISWSDVGAELGRGIAIGPVFVPTDPEMRMLVNYRGPSRTFPTYSLSQVLAGTVPSSVFHDRVVLIGANAIGTRDTFQSPFTFVMPGVERLATVIDSILHQDHVRRPEVAPWFEVGLMLASALAIGFAMSRLSLAGAFLCAVAIVLAVAISGQVFLVRYGVWQATAVPIVAIVLTFLTLSLYRYGLLDKERRHIRHVFQRYLAPNMVEQVVSNPKLPELGGELRDLTVLFCDIRGFTALSERLDAAALTRVANQFFSLATEAILEYGGTVDKYIGDAIMAFWNAPIDQPDHAALACRAALRILEEVAKFNEALEPDSTSPRLDVGIGINTGSCTVGNFGSSRRFDYSAIGDTVNVAARLEGETKTYRTAVLLGPETAARAVGFATLPIDRIQLRGREEALEVYVLAGDEKVMATPSFQDIRATHLELRAAIWAQDENAVQQLVDKLRQSAPANLQSMYDAFALRARSAATLAS